MFYYQKAVEYESSKFWVRIILALGTNHLNFGYESSGYETSVGTKRPDSPGTRKWPIFVERIYGLFPGTKKNCRVITGCPY